MIVFYVYFFNKSIKIKNVLLIIIIVFSVVLGVVLLIINVVSSMKF